MLEKAEEANYTKVNIKNIDLSEFSVGVTLA